MKNALHTIKHHARKLLRNPPVLITTSVLYLLTLLAFWLFIRTREATVWQLLLTTLTALAVPGLFFLLQSAAVNAATSHRESFKSLLRASLRALPKIIVISVPIILLAALVIYGMSKLQARFDVDPSAAATQVIEREYPAPPTPPGPLQWSSVFFSTLRFLILGIALPLFGIHLWLAVAKQSLGSTLRQLLPIVRRAFSARSVMIYSLGLLAFGVLPYFLIMTRTRVSYAWLELAIFGLRLILAFALTLWGWVITISALADDTPQAPAPLATHSENLDPAPVAS